MTNSTQPAVYSSSCSSSSSYPALSKLDQFHDEISASVANAMHSLREYQKYINSLQLFAENRITSTQNSLEAAEEGVGQFFFDHGLFGDCETWLEKNQFLDQPNNAPEFSPANQKENPYRTLKTAFLALKSLGLVSPIRSWGWDPKNPQSAQARQKKNLLDEQAFERNPNNIRALNCMIEYALNTGNLSPKTIGYITLITNAAPLKISTWILQATFLMKKEDYKQAKEFCDFVINSGACDSYTQTLQYFKQLLGELSYNQSQKLPKLIATNASSLPLQQEPLAPTPITQTNPISSPPKKKRANPSSNTPANQPPGTNPVPLSPQTTFSTPSSIPLPSSKTPSPPKTNKTPPSIPQHIILTPPSQEGLSTKNHHHSDPYFQQSQLLLPSPPTPHSYIKNTNPALLPPASQAPIALEKEFSLIPSLFQQPLPSSHGNQNSNSSCYVVNQPVFEQPTQSQPSQTTPQHFEQPFPNLTQSQSPPEFANQQSLSLQQWATYAYPPNQPKPPLYFVDKNNA